MPVVLENVFSKPASKRGAGPFSTIAKVLFVLLAFLLFAAPRAALHAQVLYGSMVGTITDSTGAVVPDADVEITSIETGAVRHVLTNGSGVYTVPNLQAGTFNVKVTKAGFSSFKAADVQVGFNTQARVDAALSLGSEQQVVSVNAEQAQLQTDAADVHLNVSTKELEDLPQGDPHLSGSGRAVSRRQSAEPQLCRRRRHQ